MFVKTVKYKGSNYFFGKCLFKDLSESRAKAASSQQELPLALPGARERKEAITQRTMVH